MIMMINDIVVCPFVTAYYIRLNATTGKWQMFVNQAFAIFLFVFLAGFWRLANF